jgi:hypothetical protein
VLNFNFTYPYSARSDTNANSAWFTSREYLKIYVRLCDGLNDDVCMLDPLENQYLAFLVTQFLGGVYAVAAGKQFSRALP